METNTNDESVHGTHQIKRIPNEDIVQVMEEIQVSEAQSKTMTRNKVDPGFFLFQDEMQVDMVEIKEIVGDDGDSNERNMSSTLSQYPHVVQFHVETEFELKRPKHAKSVTGLQTLQTKWNYMFHHLVNYKKVHGDCLVPNRYKPDISLGLWVSTQRRQV